MRWGGERTEANRGCSEEQLPLWATGAQSPWGTLESCRTYLRAVPLDLQGSWKVYYHLSSHCLRAILGRGELTPQHFRSCFCSQRRAQPGGSQMLTVGDFGECRIGKMLPLWVMFCDWVSSKEACSPQLPQSSGNFWQPLFLISHSSETPWVRPRD